MSVEILNARSDPTPGGPPSYLSQSRRYNKSAETVAKQNAFLRAYAEHGTITHSARAAGIAPAYHYNWLDIDPDYPAKFKEAHQEAVEALELEARRRAVNGVEEPTGWYKGEPGGFVKRYSDTLLIFLLKGALPDKYKDRHEHTGKNGGPIEVQSTVTIEQFPIWLKQAIVVCSTGIEIDPEVEKILMSHFEAKFLEAEKLVGKGITEGQNRIQEAGSYHAESIDTDGGVAEGTVGQVMASVVETSEDEAEISLEPSTVSSLDQTDEKANYRPNEKRKKVFASPLSLDDI